MKQLKPNTKQAQHFISAYEHNLSRNNGDSLYEIYGHFSNEKQKALEYCKSLKNQLEGWQPCFTGHSCDTFSYGFLFIKDNKTYLAYITYANDYCIEYE